MSIDVRTLAITDWEQFQRTNATAFGWEPHPDHIAEIEKVFEFDRSLAAYDGAEIVGTTSIFTYELTVPGGALPAAGVTWVSVKPTHRRQGILRQIMQKQLIDVRERNEPLAILWASESIIYGRFGYGIAAQNMDLSIDRLRTTLAHQRLIAGRMRIVSREEALEAWPAVYDEARLHQPGLFSRNDVWWKHMTMRAPDMERRMGTRFNVQYEEDGRVLGYARYRIKGEGGLQGPTGSVSVEELTAVNDEAYTALWQYIFGIDLVATIEAGRRPVDEPLYWMLADPRRLGRRTYDSLWLRVVDVTPALEGRRYSAAGHVVLDVRDPFCQWNEGRYELEAGAEGARCRRTDSDADITLSAADLGAVYLGGARLAALRRAGRVEGDWDAVHRADAMFSWDPLPWCPEVF